MKWLRSMFLLLLIALSVSAQEKLTYRVEYSTAKPQSVHIVIIPDRPLKAPVRLIIPRAITSGYDQQLYDRYVEDVSGTAPGGASSKVEREDGPRWRLGEKDSEISRVEYAVNLARLEQEITSAADASKVRPEYVGLLGYSVFGFLEAKDNLPIQLEITGPESWPVFTTLAPKLPADKTRTAGEAANFYSLADSQIAMGPRLQVRKLDAPLPLFLIYYAEVETDIARHGELLSDAFRKTLAYFRSAPFKHYTAYIEVLKPVSDRHSYGFSMEHLDSSTYFLGTDRAITPKTPLEQMERDRYNFAHHISHSWIPKRVYGTGYLPFTWELVPLIDTIWFNEGFARFITIEALADQMPEKEGREFRERQFDAMRRTLAAIPEFIRNMPLLELSRVGSFVYSEDFRTGRTLFSKGALMADEMDAFIRQKSGGKKRLRDSLRALVKWGEQSGRAFRLEELPGLIAKPVEVDEFEIKKILERWLDAKQ